MSKNLKKRVIVPKLQLFFDRAKIFHAVIDDTEVKYKGAIGKHMDVPFWVEDTLGFSKGVEDGSIIDMTPTTAREAYKKFKAAGGSEAALEPKKAKDEEDDEDEGPAKPAFGGAQPVKQAAATRQPAGLQSATGVKAK